MIIDLKMPWKVNNTDSDGPGPALWAFCVISLDVCSVLKNGSYCLHLKMRTLLKRR